jgi:DNA polymerase III subunit gamma/tau
VSVAATKVPVVALALYRTYRPGRFADVVGQDHVTAPLVRAIEKNRVHHAYLFSGPRGCGKTSSARILARSLNCEQGPTAEPCGTCPSCVDLAPNGSGSLDVIELDAATHGLVDDARELRERAHFAPMASRYKIYIIDEAHMLSTSAANALLKIIEEPPPHVRFVFATTSPDKILPTIRSRTHHYPFRLVPARTMAAHLSWVCEQEGATAEPAALDLVARAGAGSVRDALSVLGQLLAGADENGVTYALAYEQLGFTDASLLDSVVTGLAAGDAGEVFHAADRVVESGHDPRRFLTDLLERLRDLLLVQTVPDALDTGLVSAPDDQAERMRTQAASFGRADLVRLAHVADEGIVSMRGTTPTRLQLELVCSRLLLPGTDTGVGDLHARMDRMERRLEQTLIVSSPAEAAPASVRGHSQGGPPAGPNHAQSAAASAGPAASGAPVTGLAPATAGAGPIDAPQSDIATLRAVWAEVLERLRELRRTPWTFIKDNAEPLDIADDVLVLGVRSSGLRDTLASRADYVAYLQQAVTDVLGRQLRIDAVVAPTGTATPSGTGSSSRRAAPPPGGSAVTQASRPAAAVPAKNRPTEPSTEPPPAGRGPRNQRHQSDRSPRVDQSDQVDPDDPVVDDVSGADLLSRELGASIVEVVDET